MKLERNLKILLINPYGIGDLLFISPLIRTLKKAYPKGKVGLLLGARTKVLFENNPDIDFITSYDKDTFKSLTWVQKVKFLLRLKDEIRREKFDVSIDFSNTDEYSFLAWAHWKIPRRIGFQYKNRGRYLTDKIELKNDFSKDHVVNHYYRLLTPLGVDPSLFENKLFFYPSKTLSKLIPTQKPMICILPGGGESWGKKASYKLWPISNYVTLINQLITHHDVDIALIGSMTDSPLCDEIKQHIPGPHLHNLCGKTSLSELAGLLSQAELIIGTESGPLHLATALDKKTIFLYGPVDPVTYGPYGENGKQLPLFEKLPCQPCYQRFRVPACSNHICLKTLSPERVYETAQVLLSSQSQ